MSRHRTYPYLLHASAGIIWPLEPLYGFAIVSAYIQEFTESVLELKPQMTEVQAAGKRLKEACSAKV